MIDERFAARVATWLHRNDRPARRPHDNVARALEQIHHTRQRRRWLWFLPGPKPTAGASDEHDRGRPPATNPRPGGLVPAPIGRTMTMLSPTRLITAAAAAALTGALLLAGPFTSREVSDLAAPAGLSDEPIVTLVSGQMSGRFDSDSSGATDPADWGYTVTNVLGTAQLDMSDARLSGRARTRTDYYARSGYDFGPFSFSMYLENDGGSWVGSGVAYLDPVATGGERGGIHMNTVLSGQAGYEGLTAILALDTPDWSSDWEVSGAVQPFALPPTPEAAPTTFD